MAVDILQSEGMAPPGQKGIDILQSEGITPPGQKLDQKISAKHKSFIDDLLKNPIVNAGVSAGQTLGQSIDNLINLSARTGLPSKTAEEAARLGVPGAAPIGQALATAEQHLRQQPLQAPQVAVPGAISTKVGQFAGMGTAFALGGEAVPGALGGLAAEAPGMARAAQVVEKVPVLGKYLPGMAGRALGAAAVAPALDPKQPLKSAAEMLAFSPVVDVASAALAVPARAAVSAVKAPVQTAKLATQKVLRNFFSKDAVPFIKGKFDAIINDIKGSSSKATSNEDLFNRLSQHYDEKIESTTERADKNVRNDYVGSGSSVGDAYDRVPLDAPADKNAFVKHIGILSSQVKKKMAPIAATSYLKKDYQNILDTLSDYKKANISTVGDAKTLKELINEQLSDPSTDRKLIPYLKSLKNEGVFNAISEGVGKGDSAAAMLLKHADARYKNEIVPFKEIAKGKSSPFWQRFTGAKPADKLGSEYLKPGAQKDQAALLDNFLKIAPPDNGETRKLLAYDYVKDAEDNPKQILSKWDKLGTKQKQMLLPEHVDALDQMSSLAKKHPAAFEEAKAGGLMTGLKRGAEVGTSIMLGTHGHLALSPLPFIIPSILSAGARKSFENPEVQKLFIEDLANKGLLDKSDIPLGVNYLRNIMLALKQHSIQSKGES